MKIFFLIFVAVVACGCTTKEPESAVSSSESKVGGPFWVMWIRCQADATERCRGEAPAARTATIPPGYAHCRTVGRQLEGPTNTAGSWWWLEGAKIRVFAAACGGPIFDRWGSSVKAEWSTYIVPAGQEHDPANQCSSATEGRMFTRVYCN